MAEKSISVRLSARVDQYVAAMKAAQASTTGFSAESQRNLTRVGGQLQSVGRDATKYVTVPLLALGVGAIAMSAKFDTAFAQMVGLANVPASEVDGLKDSVLALAGETAQAPQDLAEALYFAASAGLDSAQAMDAVELAAKGAAAGMGSAQDIVGLTASAVASYGAANITAAEATDILTATIREGRAEPAELAATLGRVLPIASQMGITFAEVGGATAYLTNIMGGADISTTALRDALMKLSAPGTAAKTALLDMGTSFEELQASISEDGLLGALELLREHGFAGNAEALHALMPDAQGYLALTALLNDESGQLAGTIDAVTNSAGSLDFAFGAVSDTSGFKMKQAITDIKVAMIEAGDVLLPIAAKIASSIADVAQWFSDLDPTVRTVVVAFAGLAAAVGPVVFIAGSFVKHLKEIKGALSLIGPGATTAGKAFAGIGAAVTVGFLAYEIFTKGQREAEGRIRAASDALAGATDRAWDYADSVEAAGGEVDGLAIAQRALSTALTESDKEFTDALGVIGEQATNALDVLLQIGQVPTFGQVALGIDPATDALQRFAEQAGLSADEADALIDASFSGPVEGFAYAWEVVADRLGISKEAAIAFLEETQPIAEALTLIQDRAGDTEGLQRMARELLNGAVVASEDGEALVKLAEAHAHASRNSDQALDVYMALNEILETMTPTERDAALAALGLSDATLESANAAVAGADAAGTAAGRYDVLSSATIGATAGLTPLGDALFDVGDKTTYAANAAKDLVGPLGGMSDAAALAGSTFEDTIGSVQGVVDALDKGGDAWRKSDDMFSDLGGAASDAAGGFAELEDAVNDLWTAFDNILNPANDLRASARDVNSTLADVSEGLATTAENGIDLADAYDLNTEAGRRNSENMEAATAAIYEHGKQMMLDGATADEAAHDIEFNTRSLHDNLIAAGFTEAQIRDLNAEYMLTPSELKTQLEAIGEAQAAAEIAHHKGNLDTIPRYVPTTVTVAVAENDIGKVNSQLANIVNQVRTAYVGVTGPGTKGGGVVRRAALGSYVPFGGIWQLHPNEAVFPLGNQPRIRELIADPRIGEPIMAALYAGNMTPGPTTMSASPTSAPSGWAGDVIIHNYGRDLGPSDLAQIVGEARRAA